MTGLLPGIELRPAQAADIGAVIALERAVESAPHWQSNLYAEALSSNVRSTPRRRLVVAAHRDGLIVGFGAASFHSALLSSAELESVAVAPHARRSGTGRALCHELLEWCRAQGASTIALEVRAGNAAAIALYASLGFSQSARRPGYYTQPPDDAVMLQLHWIPSIHP